jgi:3-oxosteroid 1-dehydrogenase
VLGDRTNKPSPCLGPVDTAPYYAVPIELSDVGTIGGAVSDECARVLGPDGTPIPGLYATGNMSATVMGRHYLGAGASVGNTMTFGYLAARHAAGSPSARTESKG